MAMTPATVLSRRLRELRTAAGLTCYALARRAGMAPISISRIESGERACSWETAVRLAEALDVGVEKFR